MSIGNYLETVLLDLVFNGTAYAGQATVYVKLHIGDPGEAGTTNAAAHTTRAAATFGAAAAGAISNDAAVTWTSMAAGETMSHISLWDAAGVAAGNCLWVGPLTTPQVVNVGNNFTIPIGDLDVQLD